MTEEKKPEPPEVPTKVRTYSRVMVLLVLATIVLYLIGVPVAIGAGFTAAVAFVVGILALVASRGHERMGSVRISIGIGMGMAVFAMLLAGGMWVLLDELVELRECEARAVTLTAERECEVAYEDAYRAKLEEYGINAPGEG